MPDLVTTNHKAESISLDLDHVRVQCKSGHDVVVTVYDRATDTLSMWHFRPVAGGHWDMDTACIDVCEVNPSVN